MKIAHLIFSFITGGSETMLVDIVNEQVKQVEIGLFIINKLIAPNLLNKINPEIKIFCIGRTPKSRNIIPILKLNYLLTKFNPDLIHSHSENAIKILMPDLKKRAVLTVHDVGLPIEDFNKYRRLFAISKAVQQDVARRAKLESVVIYNGIQIDFIKRREDFNKSNIFKIVQVGRLDHQKKGQHLSIEAIKILHKRYNIAKIYLDFIGEGASEQFLKELVKNFSLEKQINFLGLRDREYIYSHLRDYDLFIQPSLYEGFGLTVVEAMVAKIPVLVSNVDGPMEIIRNGELGYYFACGNADNLADRIHFIYNNYGSKPMIEKVENAFNYAINEFDVAKTANRYLEEYKVILNHF